MTRDGGVGYAQVYVIRCTWYRGSVCHTWVVRRRYSEMSGVQDEVKRATAGSSVVSLGGMSYVLQWRAVMG